MQTIDWRLFELVNGLAGHVHALDSLMKLCASSLEYALLVLVGTLWITPAESDGASAARQRIVIYALLAALLALGVNQVISHIWFRPRPFAHHSVTLLVPHAADASFPSDHAAGGFALAASVWLAVDRWARRLGWLLLALAAVLALARVYIGVHYPFDVIGGALIGAATAWLVWLARTPLDLAVAPLLRPAHRLTTAVLDRAGAGRWQVAAGGMRPTPR
ncbi:MAG TPA: undecaprenyl-diphosphatase [Dehalococcoidia bacterium]|nr:undecaprenyl-diphosphatase [Dehalococcoidia bacterium]